MFARGVDRCPRSFFRAHVLRGPFCYCKFRMLGVVAARNAVAVFKQNLAVSGNQHRTKRFVAGIQRGRRQLDAASQMYTILFSDHRLVSLVSRYRAVLSSIATDRLDIVAVRVKNERCIVAWRVTFGGVT